MRAHRLLTLALLLLAGCATQVRTAGDLSAYVEQQMDEHRFGAALATIENFSGSEANTTQVKQLRDRVTTGAARFESEVIAAASAHVEQGNWHAAQLIYQEQRRRYPESVALAEAEQRFIQLRDAHIARLRSAQYAEKAQYLQAEIAQLELISAAKPGNLQIKRELQQQKKQQRLIATALLDAGERQLAAKNFPRARQYLTLSNKLIASAAAEDALRQIPLPRKKPAAKAKVKKRKPPVVQVATAVLAGISRPDSNVDSDAAVARALVNCRTARQQGELAKAKQILDQTLILKPRDYELLKESNTLREAIAKRVQQKLEKGKYLYSIGEIDAAINAWQLAVALAPQDQSLQQRLERAQKFRHRYEQLKK